MGKNDDNFTNKKKSIITAINKSMSSKYYGDLLRSINNGINALTYRDFAKIPISTKKIFEDYSFDNFNKDFISAKAVNMVKHKDAEYKTILKDHDLSLVHTSGTTGQPTDLFRHNNDLHSDFIYLNKRRLRSVNFGEFAESKYIWIWPLNEIYLDDPIEEEGIVYAIENEYGYNLPLSSYTDYELDKVLRLIQLKKIKWLNGLPSALSALSHYMYKHNVRTASRMEYIECVGEKLFGWQENLITDAFGIAPANVYSAVETSAIAFACNKGNLHTMDNCFVEIIDCNDKGFGNIIVTKLNNTYGHLIRYALGDMGRWIECDCGDLKNPAIELSGYRSNDKFIRNDGTAIEPYPIINAIMFIEKKAGVRIVQQQVVQKEIDLLDISYKTLYETTALEKEFIRSELEGFLHGYLGDAVHLVLNIGTGIEIAKKKYGKFQVFINEL